MDTKFSKDSFVNKTPKYPNEINLIQAVGVLPHLAPVKTKESLIERLAIHDPVIRTWALTQLIQGEFGIGLNTLKLALHVAPKSSYLRQNLFDMLIKSFRFGTAKKILEANFGDKNSSIELNKNLMIAKLQNNYQAQVILYERLYLETGDVKNIASANEIARARLNWQEALKPMLRAMFVGSVSLQTGVMALLRMLERENARAEFLDFFSVFKGNKDLNLVTVYGVSQSLYWDKKYPECINYIMKSNVLKVLDGKGSLFTNLLAKCYEESGQYEESATWYKKQNDSLKQDKLTLAKFIKDLDDRAKYDVGNLKEDVNSNYLIMTGFPRSGTTLLENVLSSHPDVVTCEETSSLIGSIQTAYKVPTEKDPKCLDLHSRAEHHRFLYYQNISRFVNKKNPKVILDKTPIISANIKYMEKIFPNKRYIFSIRHPYDVVLSNYKQDYQPNIAMAAFTDIYESCVLYDYVMSNWFDVFPGETDRVHYIKYDDLVNNFEETIRGALNFLSVPWTDEVTKFAEHASKRAVRTPSYANVRKGLTIGVQSSWQNFDFLFDDACKKLLDPWVKRFGYS